MLEDRSQPGIAKNAQRLGEQVRAALTEIISHSGMPLQVPQIDYRELAHTAQEYSALSRAAVLLIDDQPGILTANLPTLVAVTNGHAKGILHKGRSAADTANDIAAWIQGNGDLMSLIVLDGSLANQVTGFSIADSLFALGVERDKIVIFTGGVSDESYQREARRLEIAICGKNLNALLPILWERVTAAN